MSKICTLVPLALIAAGVAGLGAGTASGQSRPSPDNHRSCFFVREWQSWKSPTPTILYFRVNRGDIYRVELTSGSPNLQRSDMHLISETRGSDLICAALDLQLSLADSQGFREPLIVKALTKLTAEEIAAIPQKARP